MITDSVNFRAFRSKKLYSEAAGAEIVTWDAEAYTCRIPLWTAQTAKLRHKKPRWFMVPVNRKDVIDRLKAHGIRYRELSADTLVDASFFRLNDVSVSGKMPLQGHMRMQGTTQMVRQKRLFLKGSIFIDMQQPLSDLCMLLLDPDSPDSFFQWGLFADVTERTEYFEMYAMAPIADEMMRNNPELKKAFDKRCLADEQFRNDAEARLRWWYERSEFNDVNYLIYPIAFEL